MTSAADSRPRQATFAAWVIMVGSGLVVVTTYERIAGLHSLETQEAIRDFLSTPPGDGLGLTMDGARSILHVANLITGASGAAAAILGFQVLRRNRTARLALTVLAVPLLVAGLAAGGFFPALVVAGVVTLWMPPTSDWMAGRPQRLLGAPALSRLPSSGPHEPSSGGTATAVQARPTITPHGGPPAPPRPIVTACWVTWAMCALVAAMLLVSAASVAASPDLMLDEARRAYPDLMEQTGLTDDQLVRYVLIIAVVGALWCALASLFAYGAYRGKGWGWMGLLVSSVTVGVLCVVSIIGVFVLLVPLVASSLTFGLLVRPESRAWCRGGSAGR